MTIAEIKNAIERLSEKERCELNSWMQNWTPDEWDRQMETDVQAGKLDALVGKAEDAFRHPPRPPLRLPHS
jgi:hypothetical protein